MYLKKLEILGFKSFAQKTEVHFHKGLTAIVGPNGCGKTNIVDAIRWCLGEQKSSTLRSDKMENVIFNGTATRKPMGMSETSLTIENNKGILPTEYSEVTISRRIFRSGESEYLLNKNLCRLKDITNLFMDTGIGSNAYSVIELKMVETILNNKAEERRTMFEEAAGVNKYKLRRRLTLKKLDEVKSDLTRVNDIVSEVEKKVSSLERQAKKADKYNKISTTLRELEIDLCEREFALYNTRKDELKLKEGQFFSQKVQLESELARLDDTIKEVKEELYTVETQLAAKRNEITSQTEKIYSVQRSISVAEERKKSLNINIDKYSLEKEELAVQLEITLEQIEEYKEKIEETTAALLAKQNERETLSLQVEEQKTTLEEKRVALKNYSETLLDKFKEITTKENDLANVEAALKRTNESLNKTDIKIKTLTDTIAKLVGFIGELSEDKIDVEQKLTEADSFFTRKQKEKDELEQKLSSFRAKEAEAKTVIHALKDKIGFLQNLINNLEGFSKGAKELIANPDWKTKDKNILANIGNANDKFRFAVEAALKNNLNNILVETIDDVKKGIEYLNTYDYGKASFYVFGFSESEKNSILDKIEKFFLTRKSKRLEKEKSFLGWAETFVETEERWKPFFQKLLVNTAVVDSLENAFALSKDFPLFNYATLNGDFVHNSGVIEAGSAPKLDDTLFGRKQLLENFKKEIPQRDAKLIEIKQTIEQLENEIGSINLKTLSENGKILLNDLRNVEKQIEKFEFEQSKAYDESEKSHQEMQSLVAYATKLEEEIESLSEVLRGEIEEKRKADEALHSLESDFSNCEADFSRLTTEQNQADLAIERMSGEKRNLENALQRSQESVGAIRKSIEKREDDVASANEELQSLQIVLGEKNDELFELNEVHGLLKSEEIAIDGQFKVIRSNISNLEQQQKNIRNEREATVNAIHQADISLKEFDFKIENLQQHIQEKYSLTLALKTFDDLDSFDFITRQEEVTSFNQQIKNLGMINPLAYSEYEEEKERLDFLTKQRTDLLDSERDLIKTIEEINITAQQLFMETFEKIREHFIRIFRGLFNPGDEADLKLEEAVDPLEAKIEIIAKPKGKRPTSIELLSGGEKTLTAIALLFAIYLVKPSPFCILDEIDAPLDDANVDRFTRILKDFSENTQFIVVTHNKRTMEACDTLYGVTMQEEGVSKLVSVRFDEELNVA
ncbi:MAG: chromosome segregation protein SMC [Ignavibacteria bacterium CG08_land_8_20_14_0_20_37_9]|nr:chromosome segregation protein SMC [Ignavibacteria bacterium]OIO23048.1 MAG: chromosome segregation protein SMC [Ignavibacteria bacterium CG1_02_37_35]PIS45226.1 MAG: chromosome segregation protein SMC [Ignavibacteria bacterium CG08_land_8_20_14_0_20_37_9]